MKMNWDSCCKWVLIFALLWMLQGCRTVGKLGELTSALGQDVTAIAESSKSTVRGYADGL